MTDQKPKTFNEALQNLTMTEEEVSATERDTFAQIEEDNQEEKKKATSVSAEMPVAPDEGALPDWVSFPQGFRIPPGKEVAFLYFRAKWTDRPEKGDRWCMMWTLSDADEKLAIKRTRGESGRTLSELTKGTIRLMDGKRADWTQSGDKETTVSPERFWDEIGAKCRQEITNIYLKTHSLSREERADFLGNCVVIRKAVVG